MVSQYNTSSDAPLANTTDAFLDLGIATIFTNQQRQFLDPDLYYVLNIIFYISFQIPVLAFGVGTNVLNILVYVKSGLKNSVSITFTALSISDLGYATFFLTIRIIALLFYVFDVQSKIPLRWLMYDLAFYCAFFQDLSAVITVFAAVQKCCCVAIPHLFKGVFTSTRAIVILICLGLAMLAAYIPIFASIKVQVVPVPPYLNTTMIVFIQNPFFWMVFNRIVLPACSQTITLVCLVVMAGHLKRSAKFRSATADSEENAKSTSSAKLGQKERRAITAVTLVLVLFIVSSIPFVALNFFEVIVPSFFRDPRNSTLRYLIVNCQNILIHVSASVNFFIYYKYNTKFKDTVIALFTRKP